MLSSAILSAYTRANRVTSIFQRVYYCTNSQDVDGDKKTSQTRETSSQDITGELPNTKSDTILGFGRQENKGLGDSTRPMYVPDSSSEHMEMHDGPPTNCCMSGCANCVWLVYADNLTTLYTNPELSKEKVLKELEAIDDQNIKAFIMMELRVRGLI